MISMSKKNNRSRALRSATSAVIEQIEPRIFLTTTPFVQAPGVGIETSGAYPSYMADGLAATPLAGTARTYSEFGYINTPIANFNPTYTVNSGGVNSITLALNNSTTTGNKYSPTAGTFDVYVLPDNDSNNGGPTTLTSSSLVYGQPGDPIGSTNAGILALGTNFGTLSPAYKNLNVSGTAGVGVASNADFVGSYSVTAALPLGYTSYTFSALSSAVQSIIASDFNSSSPSATPLEFAIVPEANPSPTASDPSAFVDYYGSNNVNVAGVLTYEGPTVSLNLNTTPLPSVNEAFAITYPSVSVNEANTNKVVEIDVTRTGTYTADAATVTYSTTNGTAVAGTNFTGATGATLSFAAGVTQAEIAIPITEVGTTGFSGTKAFTVKLGTATPAPVAGLMITNSVSATATTVTIVGASGLPASSTAAPAESVTDIEGTGAYYSTAAPVNGLTPGTSASTNGTGNFGYQAFEVLEFSDDTSPNLYPATGTTLAAPTALTLSLDTNATYNVANISTTSDPTGGLGEFNVYFVPDSDSETPTASLDFKNTTFDGVAGQAEAILLGQFSYSGGIAPGGFDSYTASSLNSTVANDLSGDLNSDTPFRLIVAPGSSKFAAEFYGLLGSSTPTVALTDAPIGTPLTQQNITFDAGNVYTATEGANETIKIDRSGTDLGGTETVTYVTYNGNALAGTNYNGTSGVLTFAAGVTSATIVIPTIYGGAIGGDKALTLTLSNVTLTGDATAIAVLGAGPQTVSTLSNVVTIKDANTSSTSHVYLTEYDAVGGAASTNTALPADDAETVGTSGTYYSTGTTHYLDVGGVYDPSSSPEYGVLDYNDPTNNLTGATYTPVSNITAINSVTLGFNLTGATAGTLLTDSVSGYLDVYLVSDNSSSIDVPVQTPLISTYKNTTTNGDPEIYDKVNTTTPASNTGTTYPTAGFGHTGEVASSDGDDYTGTQFGAAYLLGNVYFNKNIPTSATTESLPLIDYDAAGEAALMSALNQTNTGTNAGKFRLVVAPASNYVYADVNGDNADTTNAINKKNGYFLTPTATINVAEGAATEPGATPPVTVANPAWLAVPTGATSAAVSFSKSAETLTVVSGSATIIADPQVYGDLPKITVDSGAQLYVRPAVGDTDVHIGGLNLLGTATADVISVGGGRSHSYHNTLVLGTLNSISDPTFSIASTAKLDLEDNDLIIHTGSNDAGGYGELATVQGFVSVGRDGGAWDGNELTSTAADTQDSNDGVESVQLAPVDNNDLASPFSTYKVGTASETVGANDIIVKYTYTGDFNLDGEVTATDDGILGLNYDGGASTGNEWALGDTNGDGLLNAQDVANFGTAFGNGTGSATADDPTLL